MIMKIIIMLRQKYSSSLNYEIHINIRNDSVFFGTYKHEINEITLKITSA